MMSHAVGTYAEREDELRDVLQSFQAILDHQGDMCGEIHSKIGPKLVEPLGDYRRYTESFRVFLLLLL